MLNEEIIKYILLVTIFVTVINFLQKFLSDLMVFVKDVFLQNKLKHETKKYIKRKIKEEETNIVKRFYGLFEFDLENCNDKEAIKKDYCYIIKDKIKTKYKKCDLKINATNKIFFSCGDFQKFYDVVNDMVNLYKFFLDINKKRYIKTNLRFSLWGQANSIDNKQAYKKLCEMNSFNLINQVIVNEGIYKQYQKLNLNNLNFLPNGLIQSEKNNESFEIYRLLKIPISKSYDK